MNVYDFDKTIYDGDSTADFYIFSLKRHKKILLLAPSLIGAFLKFYVFKIGTKTQFKEKMYKFLKYCDIQKDITDFWNINIDKIKPFYKNQQQKDDVIISASPEFLLAPICKTLKINYLLQNLSDYFEYYNTHLCKSKKINKIHKTTKKIVTWRLKSYA